ncbi:MAG: hypothetical protein SGPRY_008298 [Prymnesium sp.]
MLAQFVWADGVRREDRCVFGTKSLVDFFERVSTFVLAVAKHRIRQYDDQYPYDSYRQQWRAGRRAAGLDDDCTFADNDAFGLTCMERGVDMEAKGSRPCVHLAIVRETFQQAGWEIAVEKVQLGWTLDILGLAVSSSGEGSMYVPETKRLGMLADIERQKEAAAKQEKVDREDAERLVGRMSHLVQVAAEGNTFLKPLYRLGRASYRVTRCVFRGGFLVAVTTVRVRPRMVHVGAATVAAREYRRALGWWHAALSAGIAVPLAPRRIFPQVGQPGCAYMLTDAAREDGTGFGGFTIVEEGSPPRPKCLFVEHQWGRETLNRLQADRWSMPAGEMFGAAMIMAAVARRLVGVTHIICFSDSVATATAVTTGSSGAP